MRQYYQEAFVVLSMLDGPNSQFGIFHQRDKLPWVELSQPNLRLRPQLAEEHTIFSNSVLNCRAWALQERLLATRILHFSKSEMFWECGTCSEREGKHNEGPNLIQAGTIDVLSEDGNFKRMISTLKTMPVPDPCVTMQTWYRLVAQYTRRHLTRSTDKLAAISAIASDVCSITGFTYLAGIWKEDLQSLLWFSSLPEERPTIYQAPSWSWAATTGQVSLRFDSERPTESPRDAKILDVDICFCGPNQFGPVSGGSLKLHASTLDLLLIRQSQLIPSEYQRIGQRLEAIKEGYGSYFGEAMLDYVETSESIQRDGIDQSNKSPIPCTAVFIQNRVPTQVAKSTTMGDEAREQSYTNWFILVVKDNQETGIWKRIGVVYKFQRDLTNFIENGFGLWIERDIVIV